MFAMSSKRRYAGTQVRRYPGTQVRRYAGTQVRRYRYAGTQVQIRRYRYAGTDTQVQIRRYTDKNNIKDMDIKYVLVLQLGEATLTKIPNCRFVRITVENQLI